MDNLHSKCDADLVRLGQEVERLRTINAGLLAAAKLVFEDNTEGLKESDYPFGMAELRVAITKAESGVPVSACDRCGRSDRPTGLWNEPGPFRRMCGPCKFEIVFTPERKAKLEAELTAVLSHPDVIRAERRLTEIEDQRADVEGDAR